MNSTPQVETTEISDAELDNVSGGLSAHAVAAAAVKVPGVGGVGLLAGGGVHVPTDLV